MKLDDILPDPLIEILSFRLCYRNDSVADFDCPIYRTFAVTPRNLVLRVDFDLAIVAMSDAMNNGTNEFTTGGFVRTGK